MICPIYRANLKVNFCLRPAKGRGKILLLSACVPLRRDWLFLGGKVHGNRGCLTTVAGSYAVYMRYKKSHQGQSQKDLSLHKFLNLVKSGDPLALAELRTGARYLARALFYVINLVTPQKIYFGGILSRVGKVLLDVLREEMEGHVLMDIQPPNLLELSQLSAEQMLYGAAFLWIEEELNFPLK